MRSSQLIKVTEVVVQVKEGGVAALNGGVKRGDRLLEVNGISVQETSHEGVLRLLKV